MAQGGRTCCLTLLLKFFRAGKIGVVTKHQTHATWLTTQRACAHGLTVGDLLKNSAIPWPNYYCVMERGEGGTPADHGLPTPPSPPVPKPKRQRDARCAFHPQWTVQEKEQRCCWACQALLDPSLPPRKKPCANPWPWTQDSLVQPLPPLPSFSHNLKGGELIEAAVRIGDRRSGWPHVRPTSSTSPRPNAGGPSCPRTNLTPRHCWQLVFRKKAALPPLR
jgi:hypothetical protein